MVYPKNSLRKSHYLWIGNILPGVRVTLWLASLIIIGAGFLALTSVRNIFIDNEEQTEESPKSES